MLRCIKDPTGVVGLTMSQIGLFIATGILLTVVFSLIFLNDWQRNGELQSLASSFSNLLVDIDNNFFENTTRFQFPEKGFPYRVYLSAEYIALSAKGVSDSDLFVTNRFIFQPWLRSSNQNWTTGADLHSYLNRTYGHFGTNNDSISTANFTTLYAEQNKTISYYTMYPLEMFLQKPVYLEKVTIFYNDDKKHDFLLVYQMQ